MCQSSDCDYGGKEVPMKIDTGSAVMILPEAFYKTISTDPVQESNIKLCTYISVLQRS